MQSPLYFDYAASTPVDPRVLSAMRPFFLSKFGNPGSLHRYGQQAIAALDASREAIARAIGADFREVIFTGSATEGNNLALRGIALAYRSAAAELGTPRIVLSAIEHESVLETAGALSREGFDVVEVPVDHKGVVRLRELEQAITSSTVLVSIMYANNEIGTVQPIKKIAEIVRARRGANPFPLLHTDVVQAFQFLPCNVRDLQVDAMTMSAHKIYGPKGVAAAYLRSGVSVQPLITGGGQEYGLRSGTENVPLIVGFAKAVGLTERMRKDEAVRVHDLSDRLLRRIRQFAPKATVHGVPFSRGKDGARIPNILNVSFPGVYGADLLMRLDLMGIAVSSGSACRSRSLTASHVIRALGYAEQHARECIRISLGRVTTREAIDTLATSIRKSMKKH